MFEDENDMKPRSSAKEALTANSAVKAAIFVLGLMLCIIVIYVLIFAGSTGNENPGTTATPNPNPSASATVDPNATPGTTDEPGTTPSATVVPTPQPFSFKKGDVDPKIKELQQLLIQKGYLAADTELAETFGAKTEAAVKLFQTENALEVNGIVDNALWTALELAEVRVEPFELKNGVTDEKVAQLQQLLMDKGYMKQDTPTTYFGKKTEEAVKLFQRTNQMTETGIVNNTLFTMIQHAAPYTGQLP